MYVLLEASKRMVCSVKLSLLHREHLYYLRRLLLISYVTTEITCTADSYMEESVKLVHVDQTILIFVMRMYKVSVGQV